MAPGGLSNMLQALPQARPRVCSPNQHLLMVCSSPPNPGKVEKDVFFNLLFICLIDGVIETGFQVAQVNLGLRLT